MTDRAEYVIHAKVKNNLLLSRILERAKNVSQFCAKHQFSPAVIGEYINLKRPAINRWGEWYKDPLRLADILNVDVEELFSEEQRAVELKTNEAWVELTRRQALAIGDPLKALDARLLVDKLVEKAGLTEQEKKVLRGRFYDDKMCDELGEEMGVHRGRIFQIEQKALIKLRVRFTKEGLNLEDAADMLPAVITDGL